MQFATTRVGLSQKIFAVAAALAVAGFLGTAGPGAADTAEPDEATLEKLRAAVEKARHQVAAGGADYGAYLAGMHADWQGDYGSAMAYMVQALNHDAGNPELIMQSFRLLTVEGEIDQAAKLAPTVIEILDRQTAAGRGGSQIELFLRHIANLVRATAAIKNGDSEAALAAIAGLPPSGASAFSGPLLKGWVAAGQQDAEEIEAALGVLDQHASFAPLVNLHRGMMYELAGFPAKAESAYQAAIDANDRLSLRVAIRAGRFFERQGDRERARALYERYAGDAGSGRLIEPELARIKADPPGAAPQVDGVAEGVAEALFNLASLLDQENAHDRALIYARLALKLEPGFDYARLLIGEVLQAQERPEAAVEAYRPLVDTDLFGFTAQLEIAGETHALGQTDKALAMLAELAAEAPERYEPHLRIGNIQRNHENFGAAAEAYTAAIKRLGETRDSFWSVYYFRGISHERIGNWPRAEADLLKALELRPEQPLVMNYLAYSWIEQGQHLERAEKMLKKAVSMRPDDGYIVDSMGWAYYKLGNYNQAVTYLERAVELRPQDPVINDHLGDAYWKVGRKREAEIQWRRALSLDPEEDDVPTIEAKIRNGLDAASNEG